MTFNNLLEQFQNKYGKDHDFIFFELVFYLSRVVKNRENFIQYRNNVIDFKPKKFDKLANLYFDKQKPLAHITGKTTFCNLNFRVYKSVLSPREVTEVMVNDFINKHKQEKDYKVLDLCCGTGVIGISIKHYIPSFEVTCVDKYWKPILNTTDNAYDNRTKLIIDVCDAIDFLNKQQSIDYLVSNPPYINKCNFNNTKMYKWESKKALIGSDNGMYFYKEYFKWLSNHKFKEAWFEIGYDLVDNLKSELAKHQNLNYCLEQEKNYLVVFPK